MRRKWPSIAGHGRETTGSIPPDRHLGGRLVALFREQGVPLELPWLYQTLPVFAALLQQSRGAILGVLSWPDIVRRHARNDPVLTYQAAELRLRRRGAGEPQPRPQFHIGEPVRLVLTPPASLAAEAAELHAVLIHSGGHELSCLAPLSPGASAIAPEPLTVPDVTEEPFEVTGPAGPQRVYTLVTRFAPRALVHAELDDAELRMALDVLASELAGRPGAEWGLFQTMVEVVT